MVAVATAASGTRDVLFFLEVQSRHVILAVRTAHPTGDLVAQQARSLCRDLDREGIRPMIPLRDRDAPFDAVFAAAGSCPDGATFVRPGR